MTKKTIEPENLGKLEPATWVEYTPEEIQELILKMTKEGESKSKIGLVLRDQYGIPKVKAVLGKTIGDILKEAGNKEELPEDLLRLIQRSVSLLDHMKANAHDYTAKRGYELTVSKIRRLVEYYQGKKLLPESWRYSEDFARLLVK